MSDGALTAVSHAPDRTRLAAVCLRIGAAGFGVCGVLLCALPFVPAQLAAIRDVHLAVVAWPLGALAIALAVLCWVLIGALRRARRWAWVTATALFVLLLPSVFAPLAVVGLFAVLSAGTRRRFQITRH